MTPHEKRMVHKVKFFSGKTCVRCGSSERLQLDHIDPSTKDPVLKKRRSNDNIWGWSEVRRQAELDKCQVLCHPCHVKKTRENDENCPFQRMNNSKLTEDDVREIRRLSSEGVTRIKLAERFGVSEYTVGQIRQGKTWNWLH